MNKFFILVLVGVILGAGGMIYFLQPGGNNLFASSGASAPSDALSTPAGSSSKPSPSAGKPTAAPPKSESPTTATGVSKPEIAASGSIPSGSTPLGSATSGTTTTGATTADSGKPTAAPTPTPGKTEAPKPAEPINDAELSSSAAHTLRDISVEIFEQQVIVRIEAEGPFPVKTFLLPNPNRLVVDLPGDWTNIKAPSVPQNRLIRSARLGSQSSGPRLVLDLRAPLTSRTVQRPDSNTVEITLE
jgi:hypothetical protein